jgi:hypothetical protein
MTYHFEKPNITPHTLQEQIKACLDMLNMRQKIEWADTEKIVDEATAFDELVEVSKQEPKRGA